MDLIHGTKLNRNISLSLLAILFLLSGCFASTEQDSTIPVPAAYEKLSAKAKRDWVWEEGILPTKFVKELPPFQDIKIFKLLFGMMKTKMDHKLDFAPKKWEKAIHRRAVVAKVKFIPSADSHFTGLFAEESLGLLRASLTYTPDKRGVSPGLAWKVFVDGEVSRDASFLTGLDSHGQDYNFFAKTFSNIVPLSKSIGAKFVSAIFKRGAKRTNYVSVKHFAEISSSASPVSASEVVAPIQLFLKNPSSINLPSIPKRDIRFDLMNLNVGETVLEVYARVDEDKYDFDIMTVDKSKEFESKSVKIGELKLESKFIASQFGDDQLFFRHQRF